jgi:hypothetical protein
MLQSYYIPLCLIEVSRWIGSFQLMMPFALGVVSGKLFDSGYFHLVEIFGGVVFTIS